MSLTKAIVTDEPRIEKVFALASCFQGCFTCGRPLFFIAWHSTALFIHSCLISHSPSLFLRISYYLMDTTTSVRMKGKHAKPVKITSFQFSTWPCSLQKHISSWNRYYYMVTPTKKRDSHPPVFWGKFIWMNSNSISYPGDWKDKICIFVSIG